eukprot:jgi/Tetstr1/439542/TSEL_027971.t1
MGIDTMFAAAEEQHLGALLSFDGPRAARMYRMRGILAASLYQQLANVEESPLRWAIAMRAAWAVAQAREDSFVAWETDLASSVAPVGNHVRMAAPRLNSAIKTPKGLSRVAATLAHTRRWCTFFDVFALAYTPEQIRMLSQSGHGSVAYLTSDTPAPYTADACDYRAAMCKCSGVATLGAGALASEDTCPHCDLSPGAADEALERHIPGYAARQRERTKFSLDAKSARPMQRRHRLVPCVTEEGMWTKASVYAVA